MDELALLKKDWKNKANFEQISELEIYKMLHKKSSSIVRWILIISILEFLVLNGLGFFITSKEIENFQKLHPYLTIIEYINYLILIGFIYLFYKNYKSIHILDSSKKLIQDIIKTRKIVNYYIFWNIFISSFLGAFAFIDGFNARHSKPLDLTNTQFLIIFIFSMLFVMVFVFVFYKLLYGILLNRLQKNYKELLKIDL